jgi:hypothetical protein
LRRLDHREYNNTVRDLLGDASRPADRFPADLDAEFFYRRAGLVSSQDYSTIRDAAEALGALVEKDAATLAPCPGTDQEGCARKFIVSFGLRAYRRLIGSCGGYFKTGRALNFPNAPHNKLLATLVTAMGFPVQGFGAAGKEGTLPELSM